MTTDLGRAAPILVVSLVAAIVLGTIAVALVVLTPPPSPPVGTPVAGSSVPPSSVPPSPSPVSSPSITAPASAVPAPPVRPLILPAAIAARAELPACGHETVNRQPVGDLRNAEVRACFLAAQEAGEAAEMITDGLTIEGGPVREIFRLLPSGEIESYLDLTQDPLGTRDWTVATCLTLRTVDRDPDGTPVFFPSACGRSEVVVGLHPEGEPSGDEIGIFERLVRFARTPEAALLAEIPFAADGVRLGLGGDLLVRRLPAELADRAAWSLEADAFRGHVGPFSALDLLADWDLGIAGAPVAELAATVGEHPHCAAAAVPPPTEMGERRRVSVQPVQPASCLTWWTVDLFLGADGTIEAVTLDLWEP